MHVQIEMCVKVMIVIKILNHKIISSEK